MVSLANLTSIVKENINQSVEGDFVSLVIRGNLSIEECFIELKIKGEINGEKET